MVLRRRSATFAAVIAALAVGAPVAFADPTDPVITGPSCPDGYAGPTNAATGCPYWLMSYTVQYPGRSPVRCPVSVPRAGAVAGSAGRVADDCAVVATVN